MSVVSVGPPLADPVPGTDWISYLAWYVNGARWAFEAIAEIRGYELDAGRRCRSRGPRGTRLRCGTSIDRPARAAVERLADDYELVALGRIANHLKRVDEVGAAFDAADLDELTDLLGHRPDPADADAELVELIERAGPADEEALVRLLDARAQRMHLEHGVTDSR